MSFNPLEMFYRLFRRSNAPRGPAATTTSSAAPAGTGTPPAGTAAASQHSNGSGNSSLAHGGDRRAFEGEERLLEHPHAPRQYPLDPEKDAELLVVLAQRFSITSVVITHYRVKESYVEYVIECVRGHDAWRVYRRYQQFKVLDHHLKQLCSSRHGSSHGAYGVVPVLPGSHWMDVTNQSPEMVEQRRRYLEIYLQQILVPKNLFYVARTALFDFLHDGEVPTNIKATGIQPLLGLLSTRTDYADDDGDDEALRREQREPQQPAPQREDADSDASLQLEHTQRPLQPESANGDHAASATSPSAPGATPSHPPMPPTTSRATAAAGASTQCAATSATMATTTTSSSPPGPTPTTSAVERRTSKSQSASGNANGFAADDSEDPARGVSQHRSPVPDADADAAMSKSVKQSALGLGGFTSPDPMQVGFTDERLPPPSANCAQCNTEFTSFVYPYRCFFCRVQFCSACLQKLSLLEGVVNPSRGPASLTRGDVARSPLHATSPASDSGNKTSAAATPTGGGGRTVPACRQCAENYSRRLDRCGTAPGGGAYRGMQSTLSTPAPPGPPVAPTARPLAAASSSTIPSSSSSSPVTASSPALTPGSCVGEERSSLMLQRRGGAPNAGPGSALTAAAASPTTMTALTTPTGSFAGRSNAPSPVGFHDFQLLTVIGRGTFGKVLKVQMRATRKVYAMKIMNKATVYRRCMTSYMKEEKAILTGMRPNPYIVRCHYAFQTEYYLVFVMDYLPGGELYDYIYPTLRLTTEAARVYAAELVLALECLHRQDVVHRDLKPENVVLTADGHICLTDFGLARRAFSRSRRRSFVGSPEYVAPETIQGQVQTAAVDWWSFGVMLYEMLSGATPFHARNNNTVYDNVLHKELALPVLRGGDDLVHGGSSGGASGASSPSPASASRSDTAAAFRGFSPEAASLLTGLLARDPSMRLQDANQIKRHPFFRTINWEDLRRRRVPAPCVPGDMRDNDVRHFKREFVSEWAAVPPLTNMTRASIEALTKCFDNFPISRTAPPSEQAGNSSVSPISSSLSPSSFFTQHGAGDARALSPSMALPPSVLATDNVPAREPVRFLHASAAPAAEAERVFHGTWLLLSVEVHALEDGRVIFPWGGDVSGLLVYSAGGRFSMQLTPTSRRAMGPVQRVTQLSKEDLCDAYCSYVASFGRFQIFPSSADDGCGVVRHFAEGNLCPNLMLVNAVLQFRVEAEVQSLALPAAAKARVSSKVATAPPAAHPRTVSANEVESCASAGTSNGGLHTAASSQGHHSDPAESSLRGADGTGAEAGADEGNGTRSASRTAVYDADEGSDKSAATTASATPAATAKAAAPPHERRLLLRLSTRPQRALDQDFFAFTSLVFEKVA